jgi:hypothetical protein
MPNPPGSISGLSSLHPFFGAMMLEFRGALNLISYRELDTHPETFSLAKADIVFGIVLGRKSLAFVLFSGHPERQSGARVAANDALDADHARSVYSA